jgi:hypothetical protein
MGQNLPTTLQGEICNVHEHSAQREHTADTAVSSINAVLAYTVEPHYIELAYIEFPVISKSFPRPSQLPS